MSQLGGAGGAGGFGGISGAGGSFFGTMADAYANPVMVNALISGREATTVTGDKSTFAPPLPGIDDVNQMDRWEAWVRAYVAVGDLLQVVGFNAGPNTISVSSAGSLIAAVERPDASTFESQIGKVLSWADLRNERANEILAQIDPQYAFWSSIVYLHPERTRRTLELINMLLQFCVYVEMRIKQALACFRPVEYNAQVQPMITTPGHGSFPMGHATQAYAVAHVIKKLLRLDDPADPNDAAKLNLVIDQLDRQAARISVNRIVAGLHFPVDAMAGRMLGVALGEFFYGRCTGEQTFMQRKFHAAGPLGIDTFPDTDFNPFSPDQTLDSSSGAKFYSADPGSQVLPSDILQYAWTKAQDEFKGRFGVPG